MLISTNKMSPGSRNCCTLEKIDPYPTGSLDGPDAGIPVGRENEGVLNLGASLARATKRSFMWTGPKVAGPRPPSSTTSFISTWSGHTLSILEA